MTSERLEQNSPKSGARNDVSRDSDLRTVMVGIPCYNEEVAIGSLVVRASQYADKVVVVDDGSTDKTAEVARLAGADVLVHSTNCGKGASVRDLFEHATQHGFDILVILDGDGQHNPDDIPKLTRPLICDEADLVNGSRYLSGGGTDTPRYRRLGQLVLDRFTKLGVRGNVQITDTQSGFRAFSMKVAPIFQLSSPSLAVDSELLMDAAKAQLRIKEVDVSVRYDVGQSSQHPVTHGAQVLVGVLRNIEFKRPLLAFTLPGLLFIGIGFVLAVYVVQGFYSYGRVPNGPAILMLLVVLIGTFMVLTGIILHSVAALTKSLEAER